MEEGKEKEEKRKTSKMYICNCHIFTIRKSLQAGRFKRHLKRIANRTEVGYHASRKGDLQVPGGMEVHWNK